MWHDLKDGGEGMQREEERDIETETKTEISYRSKKKKCVVPTMRNLLLIDLPLPISTVLTKTSRSIYEL